MYKGGSLMTDDMTSLTVDLATGAMNLEQANMLTVGFV